MTRKRTIGRYYHGAARHPHLIHWPAFQAWLAEHGVELPA